MSYRAHSLFIASLLLASTLTSIAFAQSQPMTDEEILATADQRIEQYRKADVAIKVVDADGPVAGATVELSQTQHRFLFGSNIFKWGKFDDPREEQAYRDQFAELLNFATVPYYWWSYEREEGKPEHENREAIARWCKENGITAKGHPLAWNYAQPRWLTGLQTEQVLKLQIDRTEDSVRRFRGLIDTWDVVNEAVHYDRDECLRRAPDLSAVIESVGREGFIRQNFEAARRANPDATLLVNDYRTDDAYYKLLDTLRDEKGELIFDVVGIQSHMHGGTWPTGHLWSRCEKYAKLGRPIHFTEMTVVSGKQGHYGNDPSDWPSTEEGEQSQAAEVARIYTVLFSHPAVEAITWWDFSDRNAWRGAPAGLIGDDLTPKPAYLALKGLIKGKWWTQQTLATDAAGQVSSRGFLGSYQLTITAGDKKKTVEVELVPGENVFDVVLD